MSFIYKVGLGWDVPEISLATVTPQCRGGHVKLTRRNYGDESAQGEGLYSAPTWNVIKTLLDVANILEQFDLVSNEYRKITWYTLSPEWVPARYNGIALKPLMGEDQNYSRFYTRDMTIYIHSLSIAA